MADLSKIPIRYFEQVDPYGFVVDNRPLRDLESRIDLVNSDITGLSNTLSDAAGDTGSLANRLNVSLEDDGSIKAAAIPAHDLHIHADSGDFVKMTSEERTKLSGVSTSASNFGLSINQGQAKRDEVVNIEESASIKIHETSSGIQFYSIVPTSYYHLHYGPLEPLVKCRKENGVFIPDEDASTPYYIRAVTTYEMNKSSASTYPTYFYTSDGVPSGDDEGTPVPFRVGSIRSETNGILTPLEYTAADAEIGRFRISEETAYFPQYNSPGDYDLFLASWEHLFELESEALGPALAPSWSSPTFSSGSLLTIRDSAPTQIMAYSLTSVPAARPSEWLSPSGWQEDFQRLSVSSGTLAADGAAIAWSSEMNPYQGTGGWTIIRKDNGSSFDYYLGWLSVSEADYPLVLFYQIESQ